MTTDGRKPGVWAAVVIAVGLIGCEIDESRLESGPGDDEFRADGCGANRHKEAQTQTCKFKGVVRYSQVANTDASCIPNDANHIVCKYNAYTDTCKWEGQQTEGTCKSDGPGITGLCVPPAQGPTTSKSYTLNLPTGSMLCDPKGKQSDMETFCWNNKPATLEADLKKACTDSALTVTKEMVECCVDDPVDDDDAVGSEDTADDAVGESTWDGGGSTGPLPDETPEEPTPIDAGALPLPIPAD